MGPVVDACGGSVHRTFQSHPTDRRPRLFPRLKPRKQIDGEVAGREVEMSELVFLIEDAPEGGYVARALGQSIFTEAETWEELEHAVRDAMHCHFDRAEDRPTVLRLHYVRDTVVAP